MILKWYFIVLVIGEMTDEIDIHLVFEYKANEKWGPYTAPRANRYFLLELRWH